MTMLPQTACQDEPQSSTESAAYDPSRLAIAHALTLVRLGLLDGTAQRAYAEALHLRLRAQTSRHKGARRPFIPAPRHLAAALGYTYAGAPAVKRIVDYLAFLGLARFTDLGIWLPATLDDLPEQFRRGTAWTLDNLSTKPGDDGLGYAHKPNSIPCDLVRSCRKGERSVRRARFAVSLALALRCCMVKRRRGWTGRVPVPMLCRLTGQSKRAVQSVLADMKLEGRLADGDPRRNTWRDVQAHGKEYELRSAADPQTKNAVLCTPSAPPKRHKSAFCAPPLIEPVSAFSTGGNPHKHQSAELGACSEKARPTTQPDWNRLTADDLRPGRRQELCAAAVDAGAVPNTRNGRLDLYGALAKVRRVPTKNPPGLLKFLLRNSAFIAGMDDDQAHEWDYAEYLHVVEAGAVPDLSRQNPLPGPEPVDFLGQAMAMIADALEGQPVIKKPTPVLQLAELASDNDLPQLLEHRPQPRAAPPLAPPRPELPDHPFRLPPPSTLSPDAQVVKALQANFRGPLSFDRAKALVLTHPALRSRLIGWDEARWRSAQDEVARHRRAGT